MMRASLIFRKSAPSSASAAEAATNLRTELMTWKKPLSFIGLFLVGREDRKYIPAARLRALETER